MAQTPEELLHCKSCESPLKLVRVLGALEDEPPLGAFYCEHCDAAETIPLPPKRL